MCQPNGPTESAGTPRTAELVARLRETSGEFVALLARYGRPAPALRHHGLIGWQRGDLPGAVASFRAALDLTPDDPDLWRDLAGVFDAAGQAAAAGECIRKTLALRPDDARAWVALAQARNRDSDQDQAVEAFHRALALDPDLGDAHFGLGLIAFSRKALDEASVHLRRAVDQGHATTLGFSVLGHVLFGMGRFVDSADAFDAAWTLGPLDDASESKRTRARTFVAIIDGRLDRVLDEHVGGAGRDDVVPLLRDAFSALSGYGYREAAITVGRSLLVRNPTDAAQRYLLDAVEGRELTRAPAGFIETHFDGFASTFDHKLVDVLLYDVPAAMARLVGTMRSHFDDVLDLGCGTGLVGAAIAPTCGRLVGVDLSKEMLDRAAKRGAYTALVKADILDYLADCVEGFDLIVAADVLIYFGDLRSILLDVARSLKSGGLFALSIETMEGDGHRLQPSGRFTHAIRHVEDLAAAAGLTTVAQEATALRIEAGRPAQGQIILMRSVSNPVVGG